jgi:predicted nucleic acid-binding protein
VTLILDSGGISALARDRDKLAVIRRRGEWPPEVPAVTLVEALTGDSRRDVAANRLLRTCIVVDVDQATCRKAAQLRTATRRAGSISAVDAIVVAVAETRSDPIVLTSNPRDIASLAAHADRSILVEAV